VAQRKEAAELVALLRREGVHAALTQATLAVYFSETHAPSEMLDAILQRVDKPRVPPVPERVRLPLRAKDDFVRALGFCSLHEALKPGLVAVDDARRGGHQFQPGEVVGAWAQSPRGASGELWSWGAC
jgi:hypothetical protein